MRLGIADYQDPGMDEDMTTMLMMTTMIITPTVDEVLIVQVVDAVEGQEEDATIINIKIRRLRWMVALMQLMMLEMLVLMTK